jgi:hypothetical protein
MVDRVKERIASGYVAEVKREGNDVQLSLGRFANGESVQSDDIDMSEVPGALTVAYDRSTDRLEARAGGEEARLNGVWSRFGDAHGSDPMVIAIGCVTFGDDVPFPGRRVRLDNFEFIGVKKAR